MKKKTISLMITTALIMGNSVPALAAPNTALNEGREKYKEIENKISDIETKLQELSGEMERNKSEIDKNEKESENIKNIIDNTEKDINQCKKDITDLDSALGQRVNAMYKSGSLEFSYLSYILEAKTTGEFFQKIQTLSTLIGKDKKSIEEVVSKKEELNTKAATLEDKKKEIEELTTSIKEKVSDLEDKKSEQEKLANEAKQERDKFDSETLAVLERADIEPMYASITSDKNSSELTTIINSLQNTKDKVVKSPIVKKEIEAQIDKAVELRNKKKKEEERAAKEAESAQSSLAQSSSSTANRGNSTTSSSTASGNTSSGSTSSGSKPSTGSGSAQALRNELNKHLGKDYVFGATGPSTFDCSGLVQYAYRNALGISLPRTTYDQINQGTPVSQSELQPGDLVFPSRDHVGIYIGGGQMIHAPHTGSVVKIAPVYKFYAGRRIL